MGMQWVQIFASRSTVTAEVMQGFTSFRKPVEVLKGLQARVAELKRSGKSSEETVELLRGEFRAKYPDRGQPLRIVAAVNAIYAEVP